MKPATPGPQRRAVVGAQLAAGHEHAVAVARRQAMRDVDRVGHDRQTAVVAQRLGDISRRRAGIHHDRVAVADLSGGGLGDTPLGVGILAQAMAKPRFAQRIGQADAAMNLAHQTVARHLGDVAADRFARDAERRRERRHPAATLFGDGLQDG